MPSPNVGASFSVAQLLWIMGCRFGGALSVIKVPWTTSKFKATSYYSVHPLILSATIQPVYFQTVWALADIYPHGWHRLTVVKSSCIQCWRQSGSSTTMFVLKRQPQCEQQHIGFEPVIMESTGGLIGATATLLLALCGIIDPHEGLSPGCTRQECQVRLALICSEVFTGHSANNCLRKDMMKPSTGPPPPFVHTERFTSR